MNLTISFDQADRAETLYRGNTSLYSYEQGAKSLRLFISELVASYTLDTEPNQIVSIYNGLLEKTSVRSTAWQTAQRYFNLEFKDQHSLKITGRPSKKGEYEGRYKPGSISLTEIPQPLTSEQENQNTISVVEKQAEQAVERETSMQESITLDKLQDKVDAMLNNGVTTEQIVRAALKDTAVTDMDSMMLAMGYISMDSAANIAADTSETATH